MDKRLMTHSGGEVVGVVVVVSHDCEEEKYI